MTAVNPPPTTGTERYTTLARYVRRATWTLALVVVGLVATLLAARRVRVRIGAEDQRSRAVVHQTLIAELAATARESAVLLNLGTSDATAAARATRASRDVTTAIDSLRRLGVDDPDVQRLVPAISDALSRWEREFADSVPIKSIGLPGESRRVQVERGDKLFGDVRARFAELLEAESTARTARALALRRAEYASLALFLLGSGALALLLLQLIRQLRGQIMEAHTAELQTTREELRDVELRERKLAERAQQLNQRLAEAQQVAQLGYWELDSSGKVYWSDEMYRLCGLEPARNGEPPPTEFYLSCVHPDDRPRMAEVGQRALTEQRDFTEQYRLRGSGNKMQTVLAKGRVVADASGRHKLVGTVQNISDRVQLEHQLRQSQKMQAVGTLAGGVAHDFNNVLTVIISYSGIVLAEMKEGDRHYAELQEIHRAAERAGDLTRQLLVFSRQQVIQTRQLSINSVVSNVERMLRRIIPRNISLVLRLNPNVATVQADSGQLEQILVNLVVNARDAMPDGGAIAIETSNVMLEAGQAPLPPEVAGGPFVLLVVTDTGIGMDDAVRARIFEPFFTTKEVGKGTGLGLATVYGIVQQSGGHIWVDSELDVGTTFKIYFPALHSAEATRRSTPAQGVMTRGSETILLAEDEAAVRVATRTILEQSGYRVIEAANGHLALDTFRKRMHEIDLVMTDMIMPGMNGRELADQLRAMRPDTPLLFTSGYTDDTVLRQSLLEPGSLFIQKPYTPQSLTAKVREALSGTPSA
jgi:signal transduction histidine kinase/CheY-like chemotaxis protein